MIKCLLVSNFEKGIESEERLLKDMSVWNVGFKTSIVTVLYTFLLQWNVCVQIEQE